jgi:hypothetical protein
MYCSKCGVKNDVSHAFCSACGLALVNGSIPVQPAPLVQPRRVSRRWKPTALMIAAIGGPFAYAYLLGTHKNKLIVFLIINSLASIPVLVAIFSDPNYWSALTGSVGTVGDAEAIQPINAWVFYFTPLGLISIVLNILIRVYILIDLGRLPKSYYDNYKE